MRGTVPSADRAKSSEIRQPLPPADLPPPADSPPTASRAASPLLTRIGQGLPLFVASWTFFYVEFWGAGWGPTTHILPAGLTLGLLGLLSGIWWTTRIATGSVWRRTPLDFLLLPVLVAGAASTFVNAGRVAEACLAWWFLGFAALLFLLVHDLLANRRITLAELTDAFLIGTLPAVLLGLRHGLMTGERAYGLLEHPNHYAAVMVVIITLAMSRWLGRGALGRWFYGVCVALACGGLFLSGSRGALVSLLGSLLVFAPRRLLIAILAVGVPVGAVGLLARWESVVSRLPIYQYALERIQERPWLGHGLFTFRYAQFGGVHFEAHNFALHIAYEIGLVGLAVFLAVAVVIALQTRRATAPDQRAWVAVLAGTALHQLVDFTWMFPGMFFMLPVMVAAVLWRPEMAPRVYQNVATAVAAVLTLVVLATGIYGAPIPLVFFTEQALQGPVSTSLPARLP